MMFGRFPPPAIPEPDDPPPTPLADVVTEESERVRLWVTDRLEEVGLPYPLALELALNRADWHLIQRTLARGATVKDIQEMFL